MAIELLQAHAPQAAAPSRIELLNAARLNLDAEEAEKIGDTSDTYCEHYDAIVTAMSFEQPKTELEVAIMLDIALFDADLLTAGCADEEHHAARLERTLRSLRAAFPSPEDAGAPAQELLALAA
jgi:hypothetical protein